jgi:hypothetical protein
MIQCHEKKLKKMCTTVSVKNNNDNTNNDEIQFRMNNDGNHILVLKKKKSFVLTNQSQFIKKNGYLIHVFYTFFIFQPIYILCVFNG